MNQKKKQQQVIEQAKEKMKQDKSSKEYLFKVKTLLDLGAGTDCDIGLIIHGKTGRTQKIELIDEDKSKFEAGKLDAFEIFVEGDIGDVISITVGLDGLSDKKKGGKC